MRQGGLSEGAGHRRRRRYGLTVGRVWLAGSGTVLWAEGVLVDAHLIIGKRRPGNLCFVFA